MAALDRLKEQLAKAVPFVLALVGVASLTTGILALHGHIDRLIDQAGKR